MLTYADSGRCSGGAVPAMVDTVWVCLACSLLLFAFFCFIFIPFASSLIRSAVVGGIGLTFNHPKVRSRPLCPYIYECICVYLLGSYVCLCRGVCVCGCVVGLTGRLQAAGIDTLPVASQSKLLCSVTLTVCYRDVHSRTRLETLKLDLLWRRQS